MNIINLNYTNSPNFNGRIRFKKDYDITRSIYCCSHGDKKFIRFVNTMAQKGKLKDLELFISSIGGIHSIEIGSGNAPKIKPVEKLLCCVPKSIAKRLKSVNSHVNERVYYELQDVEYYILKNIPHGIKHAEFENFERNINKLAVDETTQSFIADFFA